MTTRSGFYGLWSTLLLVLCLAACSDGSDNSPGTAPQPEYRPIVFVHGQLGSAQQFETQAMRFTSNDYPQDLLFAFEYDTNNEENPLADLDAFIDQVLAATGADEVYAIGHSRGTSLWTGYLEDEAFAGQEKVAKYVNIDGRSPAELPGGVPTIGIWGEWNSADSGYNRREDNSDARIGPNPEDNYHFPGKSHSEVASSAEAFAIMYEFLTGLPPATTSVTPVEGAVMVAGRAVIFPDNVGFAGTTVEIWDIDPSTGQRTSDSPRDSFQIGPSGNFGPVELSSGSYYEFALLRDASDSFPVPSVHHFYGEPFTHDNYFLRLQASRPGESLEAFLPRDEDASGFLITRMREFWGDQGSSSDELFVNGLNVLTPATSPRSGVNLAVFLFDQDGDKVTDLDKGELFPFNAITFLTGADVFTPASFGGTGTVAFSLVTRGGGETRLNVPDWPSWDNRISIMFRDDRE